MYVIRIFPIVPYIYITILVIHGKVIHTSNSFNFTEPPESILVLHPHQSNETSNLGEDRWWPKIQSHQHVNTLSVRKSSNLGHTYQDLHVLQPPKWWQVSASWNPNLWVFASAGRACPVSKADPQMTHLDVGRRLGHPNLLHHLVELELWKDPKSWYLWEGRYASLHPQNMLRQFSDFHCLTQIQPTRTQNTLFSWLWNVSAACKSMQLQRLRQELLIWVLCHQSHRVFLLPLQRLRAMPALNCKGSILWL